MSKKQLSGNSQVSESASDIQQSIIAALRDSHNLKREPDDFLERILSKLRYTPDALQHAIDAIYKRVYYSASCDLEIDPTEQCRLSELIRLLHLGDKRVAGLNYQVGLSLYEISNGMAGFFPVTTQGSNGSLILSVGPWDHIPNQALGVGTYMLEVNLWNAPGTVLAIF